LGGETAEQRAQNLAMLAHMSGTVRRKRRAMRRSLSVAAEVSQALRQNRSNTGANMSQRFAVEQRFR